MRYWWVNQNQTFEHEVGGGYLWSPKENKDGSISHYYENMREVSSGDLVFSFYKRHIAALGFALSTAYTCPKPSEFGKAGPNWNNIGWRVDVAYQKMKRPIEPRAHMDALASLLPKRYSPIRPNGDGNQIYLAEVSRELGQALLGLMGEDARPFVADRATIVRHPEDSRFNKNTDLELVRQWERAKVDEVNRDPKLTQTQKEQVIKSRRGQGEFRRRVSTIEKCCRVTRVERPEHLIASHIKPWKVSNNAERLDGENGLFLTPSIDHLFDGGYISFRDSGVLLVSPTADRVSLTKMGVPKVTDYNVGSFSRVQARYLEYHRDSIFLKARE